MTYTSGLSVNIVGFDADVTSTAGIVRPSPPPVNFPRSVVGASSLPDAISSNWGKLQGAQFTEELQARLLSIAGSPAQPNMRSLTPQSLGEFLDFWNLVRAAAVEPELSVAPDGTLSAVWFKSQQQKLDVRFVPGQVVFGLFSKRAIQEGIDSLDIVANNLRTHPAQPLQWAA